MADQRERLCGPAAKFNFRDHQAGLRKICLESWNSEQFWEKLRGLPGQTVRFRSQPPHPGVDQDSERSRGQTEAKKRL